MTAALKRTQHHAAADTAGALAEQAFAGIGYGDHPLGAHFKHAQLVDRTEAVLYGTQKPVLVLAVAFKVEHRVHHVLQNARPRKAAFLGHVAHDEYRGARFLGKAHNRARTLPHLRHTARGAGAVLGDHGLDGVDDEHVGLQTAAFLQHAFHVVFREHVERILRHADARRAHFDLMSAFFAADIEHAALLAETSGHLQKQRAFADARIAADENGAAWHQTASQHAVQLLIACGGPGHGTFLYLAQWNGFGFLGGLIPGRLFGGLAGN